jgi:hypothetical protein
MTNLPLPASASPAAAPPLRVAGVLCLGVVLATLAAGAKAEGPAVATVKVLNGTVELQRGGTRSPVAIGTELQEGDELLTGSDGSVGFTFSDNSQLSLGPATVFLIERYSFDSTTHAGRLNTRIKRGSLGVISGKLARQSPDAVKVATPNSILGVRGTEFLVEVPGEQP